MATEGSVDTTKKIEGQLELIMERLSDMEELLKNVNGWVLDNIKTMDRIEQTGDELQEIVLKQHDAMQQEVRGVYEAVQAKSASYF